MKKQKFGLKLDNFILLIFLLVSSVMLAFSGGGFIINFKKIGFSFISETEKAMYSVSSFLGDSVVAVRELTELKAKYNDAKKKLADYELLQRANADIMHENDHLKKLLGFSKQITIKNIPSEIIGFDPNHLYSGIIINRGIKQGVKRNMPVVAFQNNNMGLVGKIVEVGQNTALIIPIYDYQCFVAAKCEGSGHRGIVGGDGKLDKPLIMKYVKKRAEVDLHIGDRILTSGFDDGSFFPKNINIGTISKIILRDYETSLELHLKSYIDFSRLEYVFILDASDVKENK